VMSMLFVGNSSLSKEFNFTGNDLYAGCKASITKQMPTESLRTHAVICVGIVNTVILLHGGKMICPPANVSSDQTIMMMVKHLENNPDKLKYPLSILAEHFFTNTWTCKN
jgi:hypothetical protein